MMGDGCRKMKIWVLKGDINKNPRDVNGQKRDIRQESKKSCTEEMRTGWLLRQCCKRCVDRQVRRERGCGGGGRGVTKEAAGAKAWRPEVEASIRERREKRQNTANYVLSYSTGRQNVEPET